MRFERTGHANQKAVSIKLVKGTMIWEKRLAADRDKLIDCANALNLMIEYFSLRSTDKSYQQEYDRARTEVINKLTDVIETMRESW